LPLVADPAAVRTNIVFIGIDVFVFGASLSWFKIVHPVLNAIFRTAFGGELIEFKEAIDIERAVVAIEVEAEERDIFLI